MPIRPLGGSTDDAAARDAAATAQARADAAMTVANNARSNAAAANTAATAATQQAADLATLAATLGAAIPASEAVHTALSARITALEGKTLRSQSKIVATTSILALGASTDLTVTWDTPMPSTDYALNVMTDATGLLLSMAGPAFKAKTPTSATVTVKALVALGAGVKVRFEAAWYA